MTIKLLTTDNIIVLHMSELLSIEETILVSAECNDQRC